MNVFITGGTGLTGKAIIECLTGNGIRVSALYRNRKSGDAGVHWIPGDLLNEGLELNKLMAEADIVIHNAASLKIGNSDEEKSEIVKVNIQTTKKLLDNISNTSVKKIIFTSSLSIIKKPLPELIDEKCELEPTTMYSQSKLIGEKMVAEFADLHGIGYNILRLSSPVNTDLDLMHGNVVSTWIDQSKQGNTIRVFGDGSRTQDFVSTEDVGKAFLLCCQNTEAKGIFNVASGKAISMNQLASIITTYFGNSFEFAGNDVKGNERWNISIEKAQRILGYYPKFNSGEAIGQLLKSIAK